jgi:histidinol-phosphate aminotransferase
MSAPATERARASPLELARPEIVDLEPYQHAAWEPRLERLHANELPWRGSADTSRAGLNRYPEPQPRELLERLAALYEVSPAHVLVGRGSDEGIDLLTRAFCRAGQDAVLVCPPTFGMYGVAARIQGADIVRVPLAAENGFALDVERLLEACTARVKLVFLCSPNNPTGHLLPEALLVRLARALEGRALLVLDEAYIEFAGQPSLAPHIARLSHLVVLRTLSKAHALAGARCGALLAAPEIIGLLRRIIPPYALAQSAIETVLERLAPAELALARERVELIRAERERVAQALRALPTVTRVWPSAGNFLLVEFRDATQAFERARAAGLLIRDLRSQVSRSLRITIGTPEQNTRLIAALGALP